MNRNIELIRYRRFGNTLLMLGMVNAISVTTDSLTGSRERKSATLTSETISEVLYSLDGLLLDLYETLRDPILALGDDIQEKKPKYYVAFKRLRNFACVEVHPSKLTVTAYLKVDPQTVTLTPSFTRDVYGVGHSGTGDLEVKIRTPNDLERAKALLQESYDSS